MLARVPLFGLAVAMTACASVPDIYGWGIYRESVARVANPADTFDLQAEIAQLEADRGRLADARMRLPPGYRLHLAYLYLLQGDQASAASLMAAEKKEFPESAHFVDGTLSRALTIPARQSE